MRCSLVVPLYVNNILFYFSNYFLVYIIFVFVSDFIYDLQVIREIYSCVRPSLILKSMLENRWKRETLGIVILVYYTLNYLT